MNNGWAVLAGVLVSNAATIGKGFGMNDNFVSSMNWGVAGLGAAVASFLQTHDWKQALLFGLTSLFSSHGYYQVAGQHIENKAGLTK